MNKNGELRSFLKCLLIQARTLSLSVIHSTTTSLIPRAHPGKTHLFKLHVKRAVGFYLKRIKPLRMSIQPLTLFNTNSVGQAVLKVLLHWAIPPPYSLGSWNTLHRPLKHPWRGLTGQHLLAGCRLGSGHHLPKR